MVAISLRRPFEYSSCFLWFPERKEFRIKFNVILDFIWFWISSNACKIRGERTQFFLGYSLRPTYKIHSILSLVLMFTVNAQKLAHYWRHNVVRWSCSLFTSRLSVFQVQINNSEPLMFVCIHTHKNVNSNYWRNSLIRFI